MAGQRFSARTNWDLGESELARAVREARAAGRELVDLTVSNPTVCGFRYEAEEVLGALQDVSAMRYDPDPRGMRSAREAVAGYYAGHGAGVDPDAVVLTTSTSEAYSFLFRLLCDAGDAVLIARPGYPLFDFLAGLDDVRLETYPLFYDFGWWIDFGELERRIGPRTRALVLVHPNNPTGHATGAVEIARLMEVCARWGLALIVDEVFLDYGLEGPVSTVARLEPECLTFVVSGLSKIAALPQMKVGWLLASGAGGGGETGGAGAAGGGGGYVSFDERSGAACTASQWLAGAKGDPDADSGAVARAILGCLPGLRCCRLRLGGVRCCGCPGRKM